MRRRRYATIAIVFITQREWRVKPGIHLSKKNRARMRHTPAGAHFDGPTANGSGRAARRGKPRLFAAAQLTVHIRASWRAEAASPRCAVVFAQVYSQLYVSSLLRSKYISVVSIHNYAAGGGKNDVTRRYDSQLQAQLYGRIEQN